jgi:hypothetical protein
MPRHRIVAALSLVIALCAVSLLPAEEKLKSGLQPGERIPGSFDPHNVTGEQAGKRFCLVCENGANPVAMIFARDVNDSLLRLINKIDAATARNKASSMGSFVVFLNDKDGLEEKLKEIAKKNGVKHLVLSIDAPEGPEDYKVAKEADVTVVLYTDYVIKANHAFRKGQLQDRDIDKILADLPKILPAK